MAKTSPRTIATFLFALLLALTVAVGCTNKPSDPKELRIGVLVTTGVELMRSSY